jgi:tetratricopeptide (TPR) repeat protein
MITPLPPLEAFRRDTQHLPPQDQPPAGPAAWLSAAILLHRWTESTTSERAELRGALERVLEQSLLLAARPAPYSNSSRASDGWIAWAARHIANEAEDAGAYHLAWTILTRVESMRPEDDLERGRCIAQRARIARKTDDREGAEELYQTVEQLGRDINSPELLSRAFVGYGILARVRGNYPDARRWSTLAAAEADANGVTEVSSLAHHTLMICAGVAGDFEQSLLEGWLAFQHTADDPDREAEMLFTLGQLLVEMQRPHSALHAVAGGVARTTLARMLLPGLGTMALAAAQLGDRRLVDHAARRVNEIAGRQILPYSLAGAHLDLAAAYFRLGNRPAAEDYRQRVVNSALAHGFHEFGHRAELLREPPADASLVREQPLGQRGLDVVARLERLGDPETLLVRI